MSSRSSEEELSRKARFVFKGTVQKLKAASMAGVPITDRTVLVRVDEIIESPETLLDFNGRDVTVQLGGRKKVKQGDQAIFYTNGWIFGEGLAVQSVDHRPVLGAAAAAVAAGDPVENLLNKDIQARVETADVVVSGRVKSVSLPPDNLIAGMRAFRAAAEPETLSKPISEHDPLIQEAVIEVDAVHKGEHGGKEVAVRFPSSTDVRWYRAPKFRPGQQGFFILHKDETTESPRAASATRGAVSFVAAAEAEETHTALSPADFQPFDQPGGIRNFISIDSPRTPSDEE